MSTKPAEHTITRPANTDDEKKAVEVFAAALERQIGDDPGFAIYKDDKGNLWASTGWMMTRQQLAAVAMFQRRGLKPKDEQGKPTKPLLASKDVEKKSLKDVTTEKKLTKEPVAITPGGGIDPKPKEK